MATYEYIREQLDPETRDIIDVEFFDTVKEFRAAIAEASTASEQYDFAITREDARGEKGWMYIAMRDSALLPSSINCKEMDFRSRQTDPDGWVIRGAYGESVCKCPARIIAQLRWPAVR